MAKRSRTGSYKATFQGSSTRYGRPSSVLYPRTFKSDRYSKAKGTFAKKVKMVIQKEAEKKQANYTVIDKPIVAYNNTNVGWASTIVPVSPNASYLAISQGTGDGQRVGNRIKIASLKLKGILHPRAYDASTNVQPVPQFVRVWLLYDKQDPNAVPAPTNDFLQSGSTTTSLSSTVGDVISEVNRDRYVVKYDKIFKVGFATYNEAGVAQTFQNFANNDFKLTQMLEIDITSMIPSTYVYNDNNSSPETRGLYLAMESVTTTGSAQTVLTIPMEMSFNLELKYTDL